MYHTINVDEPTILMARKLAERDGRPIGLVIKEACALYYATHKTKREPIPSKRGRTKQT